MIHIEESYPHPAAVVIQIDGKLDRHTIPTLHEVYRRHFESQPPREITIEICRLDSISIEGKEYLREIQDRVRFSNIPEFLRLELETNDIPAKTKPGIRK
ncbi:MAG: hypothetical protein ABIK68_15370 [bacterium]